MSDSNDRIKGALERAKNGTSIGGDCALLGAALEVAESKSSSLERELAELYAQHEGFERANVANRLRAEKAEAKDEPGEPQQIPIGGGFYIAGKKKPSAEPKPDISPEAFEKWRKEPSPEQEPRKMDCCGWSPHKGPCLGEGR
jgi:hypothetical protein